MKKIIICLLGFGISTLVYSQNVGIGTTTVPELLTVNGTALIDAGNLHNGTFANGKMLKFGTVGGVGIGSNKFGESSLNGLEFFTNSKRRFLIDSSGKIGMGSDPVSGFRLTLNGHLYTSGLAIGTYTLWNNYVLDVNGVGRFQTDLVVDRDLFIDRYLYVGSTSNFFGNINASNSLTVTGDIMTSSNLGVAGDITISGKGIVKSNSGTQQVIAYTSGNVLLNAAAGAILDIQFAIPANVFSANPRVSIAQLTNHSGTFERWTYSVVNVDYLNNSFWVRFYNSSTQSSTAAFTLNFVLVGPAL